MLLFHRGFREIFLFSISFNHGQCNINNETKFKPDSPTDKVASIKFKMNVQPSVNQPTVMDIQISNNDSVSNNPSDYIAIPRQIISTLLSDDHNLLILLLRLPVIYVGLFVVIITYTYSNDNLSKINPGRRSPNLT